LHALLLAELNGADQIDWERALIDASFAKAPEGASLPRSLLFPLGDDF
jgi:hypothetical protein